MKFLVMSINSLSLTIASARCVIPGVHALRRERGGEERPDLTALVKSAIDDGAARSNR